MKSLKWTAVQVSAMVLCLASQILQAQTNGTTQPPDTPYAVVSRDAHSSTWEQTAYEVTPSGELRPHLHRYVETATGLNYWNPATGQWEASSEMIEQSSGGAIARQGQHTVSFASDLSASESIDITMPDGQLLKTRLLGLSYYDSASGQSVLISEITNCTGQIIAPNQVCYDNAFSGIKAGVRYTYTRDRFEQDIILEEQPPRPEAFGLNSSSTILQALTEFISPPSADVTSEFTFVAPGLKMEDQSLVFGKMKFGKGRAFLIGDDSKAARVTKQWLNLEGRQFLVEEVPIPQIAAELQSLPAPTVSLKTSSNSVLNMVSTKHLLPRLPMATTTVKPMRIARGPVKKSGFVLDYVSWNTSQTNIVFQGDTTYHLSGNINLYGTTTTFEGGTILKFSTNVTLTVNTPVTWLGAYFHPVVMVAKDDNAVGETVSGSTGNPGNKYYAATALRFDGSSALTNLSIENLRIANSSVAMAINGQVSHVLNDVQLVNCGTGIAATNTDLGLHNALFWNVLTNFSGSNATLKVEQFTSDTATWLNQNITNLFLTNCLLTAVTNIGSCTTDHVAVVSTNARVFQVVGAGSHYLATNSPYREAGTHSISPAMLAALQQKTTYPPIVYFNTPISAAEFGPRAQRDTNTAPDLGYHYDPLDWCFGVVTANGNLTFDAGTAVGWFETSASGYGIALSNRVTNTFNGTVMAPCVFARYSTVQEGRNGNWSANLGYWAGITTVGNSSYFAEIDATFTHCYGLGGGPNHFRDYLAQLNVHANHSEFHSGAMAGYWLGQFMTNCLFDRLGACGSQEQSAGLFWRNCTMHGGQVLVIHSSDCCWPVWIENCAFDGTSTNMDDYSGGNTNITYCNFNAFMNGAQRLKVHGSDDKVVTNAFSWQSGPLGIFYQATNSPLIDKGSITADKVGLYQFTTQTNQAKEFNSVLDIGYHYVATDVNGNALDSDGDGIPDYLADANGNGIIDAGETPWANPPFITTQPQSQSVAIGGNALFTVAVTSAAPVSYQWQKGGHNLTDSGQITGTTTCQLSITSVGTNDADSYSAIVSSIVGQANSSDADLTVIVPPTIITQPTDQVAEDGGSVTFSVVAVGLSLNYQWRFNGANIPGATNDSYTKDDVDSSDVGSYDVVIQNVAGIVTSTSASLTLDTSSIPGSTWRFDTADWTGAQGQVPIVTSDLQLVAGLASNAVEITNADSNLRYNLVEANGHTNLDMWNGTVRLWFKPNWNSVDITDPFFAAALVTVNSDGNGIWQLDAQASGLQFMSTDWQTYNNGVFAPFSFVSNRWYQIAVTYTPSNASIYVNGELAATGDGVPAVPPSDSFAIGSDIWGDVADGTFDDLEIYNYPRSGQQIYGEDADGNGLGDDWEMQYFGHLGNDPNGKPAGDDWTNLQKALWGLSPFVFYSDPTMLETYTPLQQSTQR